MYGKDDVKRRECRECGLQQQQTVVLVAVKGMGFEGTRVSVLSRTNLSLDRTRQRDIWSAKREVREKGKGLLFFSSMSRVGDRRSAGKPPRSCATVLNKSTYFVP